MAVATVASPSSTRDPTAMSPTAAIVRIALSMITAANRAQKPPYERSPPLDVTGPSAGICNTGFLPPNMTTLPCNAPLRVMIPFDRHATVPNYAQDPTRPPAARCDTTPGIAALAEGCPRGLSVPRGSHRHDLRRDGRARHRRRRSGLRPAAGRDRQARCGSRPHGAQYPAYRADPQGGAGENEHARRKRGPQS